MRWLHGYGRTHGAVLVTTHPVRGVELAFEVGRAQIDCTREDGTRVSGDVEFSGCN